MKNFLIGGAGFSGATLARHLAQSGHRCQVIDERNHIGGMCHTSRDEKTGIMLHHYGPRIFHTDNHKVWDFINSHGEMMPYRHQVFTHHKGELYKMPIHLATINQFFGECFSSNEAKAHIERLKIVPQQKTVHNFEEQALALMGRALYEAFFKHYTYKQWGMDPKELPASILKRLPMRFDDNDHYFSHHFCAIPKQGYSAVIESILDHPLIEVILGESLTRDDKNQADHVFFTGTIDGWFGYDEGRLAYRTLDFEMGRQEGDFQKSAVVNEADLEPTYTRITEHKHFAPWETHDQTIYFKEYSRQAEKGDIPFYPIRLAHHKEQLALYLAKARQENNVSFLGRLGTYRYLDMDVVIKEAIEASATILLAAESNAPVPVFFVAL